VSQDFEATTEGLSDDRRASLQQLAIGTATIPSNQTEELTG
jgi:hypothetical protein